MNKMPIYIPLMSIVFFSIAMLFPVQIVYIYGVHIMDFSGIFGKLTLLNIINIFLLLLTSILTMKMSKYVFYALPILNFFIFFNNFIVAEYGQYYNHVQTLLSSILFLVMSLGFYQKDIYKVYHDLRYRYWLVSTRFKKQMPVLIEFENKSIWAETHDISQSGMFIKDQDLEHLYRVSADTKLTIKLSLGNGKYIPLSANIVRKSLARGTYPQGVGVKFEKSLSNYDFKLTFAKRVPVRI